MNSSGMSFETFLQSEGIYEKTIEELYDCEILFLARESIHVAFFVHFMADEKSCLLLQKILFNLVSSYLESYSKNVSLTQGDIEKRMKSGKIMVTKFEQDRNVSRGIHEKKFLLLPLIQSLFDEPQNDEIHRCTHEQGRLLFCYLEDLSYKNFWTWHHQNKGLHVDNFITQRASDTKFDYSETMLHKVYDITGYLCGHRVYNLIHLNRLRHDYVETFQNYYNFSRHANGNDALAHNLPAQCILFREHSEGLYYSKTDNFNFMKIVQAIWMQSLTTDVLILFNAFEPIKRVHKVILNSKNVQLAFKKSCFMLQDLFKEDMNLAVEENPISFLFQFIINGFIRTHAKDIYQLRLSNALLSKTGASGIRTNLLSFSAKSVAAKENINNTKTLTKDLSNGLLNNRKGNRSSSSLSCPCGKGFVRASWFDRHVLNCNMFRNTASPLDHESAIIENLIDLEGVEELGEYAGEDCESIFRNAEKQMEIEENEFDASSVFHLRVDDVDS